MEPWSPFATSATPAITFRLGDDSHAAGWIQPLAGESLWSDRPLAHGATPVRLQARGHAPLEEAWTPIYDGPGLLAGGLERIRSARGDGGGYKVTHADGETFLIAADGAAVRRVEPGSGERMLERALGAPLALALALRGTYLLHASGLLLRDGSVIALTADSGGGKSTLAAAAEGFPELELTRVADDQLPVRLGGMSVALPHFPQLKLQAGDQYPLGSPASSRLRALVVLETFSQTGAPESLRQSPPDALQCLIRATVAAKLFGRDLLASHFEACATAALALPVYRLRYPWGFEHLGDALAALARLQE